MVAVNATVVVLEWNGVGTFFLYDTTTADVIPCAKADAVITMVALDGAKQRCVTTMLQVLAEEQDGASSEWRLRLADGGGGTYQEDHRRRWWLSRRLVREAEAVCRSEWKTMESISISDRASAVKAGRQSARWEPKISARDHGNNTLKRLWHVMRRAFFL